MPGAPAAALAAQHWPAHQQPASPEPGAPSPEPRPWPPQVRSLLLTALEVASALAYLHSRSILHGDLSSNNILITSSTAGAPADGPAAGGLRGSSCMPPAAPRRAPRLPPASTPTPNTQHPHTPPHTSTHLHTPPHTPTTPLTRPSTPPPPPPPCRRARIHSQGVRLWALARAGARQRAHPDADLRHYYPHAARAAHVRHNEQGRGRLGLRCAVATARGRPALHSCACSPAAAARLALPGARAPAGCLPARAPRAASAHPPCHPPAHPPPPAHPLTPTRPPTLPPASPALQA
jgi:hypothetical protein